MTMRDRIAAVIWDNRGKRHDRIADAILAALPGMVPELVWVGDARWPGSLVSSGYSIEEQDEDSWSASMADDSIHCFGTLEDAKAAANAHHRAAVCEALGLPVPK